MIKPATGSLKHKAAIIPKMKMHDRTEDLKSLSNKKGSYNNIILNGNSSEKI